jgi:hypothetical protein
MDLNNSTEVASKLKHIASLHQNAADKFSEVAGIFDLIRTDPETAIKKVKKIEAIIKKAGEYQTNAALAVMELQTLYGETVPSVVD